MIETNVYLSNIAQSNDIDEQEKKLEELEEKIKDFDQVAFCNQHIDEHEKQHSGVVGRSKFKKHTPVVSFFVAAYNAFT